MHIKIRELPPTPPPKEIVITLNEQEAQELHLILNHTAIAKAAQEAGFTLDVTDLWNKTEMHTRTIEEHTQWGKYSSAMARWFARSGS